MTITASATTAAKTANQQALLDELVERIVAMAKVLYGLHVVSLSSNSSPTKLA